MSADTFDMFTPKERGRFGDNESAQGNDSVASDLLDLDIVIHAETDKALLVSTDGNHHNSKWLPRSKIKIEHKREQHRGQDYYGNTRMLGTARITLPEWLAKEKGLI